MIQSKTRLSPFVCLFFCFGIIILLEWRDDDDDNEQIRFILQSFFEIFIGTAKELEGALVVVGGAVVGFVDVRGTIVGG